MNKIRECLGLFNSMIACGEDHSAQSKQVYRDAQDLLTELESKIDLPDSVMDCHKIIKRLETENFGQSDLITNLETENAKLKELLDECFENGIAALGANEPMKPHANSEDLANRVFKVLKGK